MRRHSPLLRSLVALCVFAQVFVCLMPSGDRVLCFGSPAAGSHGHCCPSESSTKTHVDDREGRHDHRSDHHCADHEHHRRIIATALPHEHHTDCQGCIDVRIPDDPSRTDQDLGVPPLPAPLFIAEITLPRMPEVAIPQPLRIEPRGIPPAVGLAVIRLQV